MLILGRSGPALWGRPRPARAGPSRTLFCTGVLLLRDGPARIAPILLTISTLSVLTSTEILFHEGNDPFFQIFVSLLLEAKNANISFTGILFVSDCIFPCALDRIGENLISMV